MQFAVHFALPSLVTLLLLLLPLSWVNASSPINPPTQAPGTSPICYICGDPGQRVTNKNVEVQIPGSPKNTCLEFQTLGLNGQIAGSVCSVLILFTSPCGCADTLAPSQAPIAPSATRKPVRPAVPPTRRPTLTPTATTSTLAPTPAPGTYPVCYVCGDPGQRVTEPDVELLIPYNIITCNHLEDRGLNGQIRNEFCSAVVLFVLPCGCADTLAPSPPTEAPVAPPTFAPHLPVTPNPSRRPVATLKPTARPVTSSPTKRPTVVPVQPTSAPVVPSVKPTPKPSIAPQPVQLPTSAAPVAKPTLAPVAVKPSSKPVARGTLSPTIFFGRMKVRPIVSDGGGSAKVKISGSRGGAGGQR